MCKEVNIDMSLCDDVRGASYSYLDGEMEPGRVAEIDAHLAGCGACARHFAGQRSLLSAIGGAGRETAPAALRARVEAILEEGAREEGPREPARRTAWRRFAIPLAAAAALALLVLQPWGGGPGPGGAAGFAADHAKHAVDQPNLVPFDSSAERPAPPAVAGRLLGVSRCIVGGRPYAHHVYAVDGGKVSVFLSVEGSPLPPPGAESVEGRAVLSMAATEGGSGAVLVSDELTSRELAAVMGAT